MQYYQMPKKLEYLANCFHRFKIDLGCHRQADVVLDYLPQEDPLKYDPFNVHQM